MFYRLVADTILVLHLCFVLFTVFGGILVLRWRYLGKFHLLCVVWGVLVQFFLRSCPLTTWENRFRELGGESGYDGGFIEYYAQAILYPGFTARIHLFLGGLLIAFNLLVYSFIFRQARNEIFGNRKTRHSG